MLYNCHKKKFEKSIWQTAEASDRKIYPKDTQRLLMLYKADKIVNPNNNRSDLSEKIDNEIKYSRQDINEKISTIDPDLR